LAKNSVVINTFRPLPRKKSAEFWDDWKIEHIRKLSMSGHSTQEQFIPQERRTDRILDRVSIKRESGRVIEVASVDMHSTFCNNSNLALSSPLYLGDMSYGALSGVPNIAIAKAADRTGVIAGTGEGGLMPEIAECDRITVQWASARFGVDASSLCKGRAVVIKIGQGAKPGIGGHLPAAKVTAPISAARRIPIGRDAISPAPHHDIYSIEDLGQRITALKHATGKPVLVKVAATNYITYIAAGVARMGAAGIIIDGAGAGTGAAPRVIRDNTGMPIELAVPSVDRVLRKEGLRENFTIIAGGRVSTPEDSVKLMALGADMTSLGTATLLALGCLMVHKCHTGFCPALITNKAGEVPERLISQEHAILWISNLVTGWTEEMREIMSAAGVHNLSELIGNRDILRISGNGQGELTSIFGIQEDAGHSPVPDSRSNVTETGHVVQNSRWDDDTIRSLRELSGASGNSPREAVISSMGTGTVRNTCEPVRPLDRIVCDGAQVTRPSIDPYREEIETSVHICNRSIRLSSPFFFTHAMQGRNDADDTVFARVASEMGLILDSEQRDAKGTGGRLMSHCRNTASNTYIRTVDIDEMDLLKRGDSLYSKLHSVLIRCPSSSATVEKLAGIDWQEGEFSGIIIDMDDARSDAPLELTVSAADRLFLDEGVRERITILAEDNSIKGAEDVFKLVALGADAAGFRKAAEIACAAGVGNSIVVRELLENMVAGMQREMKLLAGASGISSVSSSLTGNRELLRAVDMDAWWRNELGLKAAGPG
jgi:glutamate synthase domain-containing protein 2